MAICPSRRKSEFVQGAQAEIRIGVDSDEKELAWDWEKMIG